MIKVNVLLLLLAVVSASSDLFDDEDRVTAAGNRLRASNLPLFIFGRQSRQDLGTIDGGVNDESTQGTDDEDDAFYEDSDDNNDEDDRENDDSEEETQDDARNNQKIEFISIQPQKYRKSLSRDGMRVPSDVAHDFVVKSVRDTKTGRTVVLVPLQETRETPNVKQPIVVRRLRKGSRLNVVHIGGGDRGSGQLVYVINAKGKRIVTNKRSKVIRL